MTNSDNSRGLAAGQSTGDLTDERIDSLMKEAFPSTKPTAAYRCFARLVGRAAISARPASQSQAAQPSELSQRLRSCIDQNVVPFPQDVLAAADEIDRLAGQSQATRAVPSAWMHEDGRVITAATMSGARKDGGAMLSSLRGYTIPLYANPTAQEVTQQAAKDAEIQQLNNIIGALTREAVAHQAYGLTQQAAKAETAEQAMVDLMPKRAAFLAWAKERALDVTEDKDAWGERKFFHSHVQALWDGWFHAPATYAMPEQSNIAGSAREGGNTSAESSDPAPTTSTVSAPTDAARDVLAERRRQVETEGWTLDRDDKYEFGELAQAGAAYAVHGSLQAPKMWPWDASWWKPRGYRRNLVKAGALILAEIERFDRAALKRTTSGKGEA